MNKEKDFLGLPQQNGITLVQANEIVSCQSDGNYTKIILTDGISLTISRQLKYLEDFLAYDFFIRVHHSYIINLYHVQQFVRKEGNYLLMKNEMQIPVSRGKKNVLLDKIKILK